MRNLPIFYPEGCAPISEAPASLEEIQELVEAGEIVEGQALRCDQRHDLHVSYRGFDGLLPRHLAVHPAVSGAGREISVLSRVGRPVQFVITGVTVDGGGKPLLHLSRRAAQEKLLVHLAEDCPPGTVLRGRVTHLASFGAFVDVGCGVVALLPKAGLSAVRVHHPACRHSEGQRNLAAVQSFDRDTGRLKRPHKELLGTWLENAAACAPGETVTGVVRSVRDYGVFVELTPNLVGLAEPKDGIQEDDGVAVYIKSILPQQKKIKLQILQRLEENAPPPPIRYFLTGEVPANWSYDPPQAPTAP